MTQRSNTEAPWVWALGPKPAFFRELLFFTHLGWGMGVGDKNSFLWNFRIFLFLCFFLAEILLFTIWLNYAKEAIFTHKMVLISYPCFICAWPISYSCQAQPQLQLNLWLRLALIFISPPTHPPTNPHPPVRKSINSTLRSINLDPIQYLNLT